MEMDRAALLSAVNTVKPALATKELIEELVHIWLDGETITAFNDASLGIQVPFKSDLKGGIRGSVLLGVLSHSRADDVEIEMLEEGWGMFHAGRSQLKLAVMAPDRAIWELPDMGKTKGFPVSKAVREALKSVLVSVGASSSNPEQMGITFILQGALNMYALDGRTMAWALVKETAGWPFKPGARVVFPTEFIENLLKLADDKTQLFINEGGAVAINGDGVKLFARLIEVPKPTDFRKTVDDAMSGTQLFSVPKGLRLALSRIEVMLDGQQDEPMDVKVNENQMKLYAKAPFGELKETIRLDEQVKALSLSINPALMARAMDNIENIGFSDRTTIMRGNNFIYLIANFTAKRADA